VQIEGYLLQPQNFQEMLTILFAVEYFGIFDIPFFDIPDYFTGKESMMDKTEEAMKQLN
jgi:hypothetical protein